MYSAIGSVRPSVCLSVCLSVRLYVSHCILNPLISELEICMYMSLVLKVKVIAQGQGFVFELGLSID